MNLNNFGSKLKFSKSGKSEEKEIFIETVVLLEHCWTRTNVMHEELGIDLWSYEETYYKVIENLIFLKYSESIANLILWYVYDRFDADGKLLGLNITLPGKEPKLHMVKTPSDLWNLIEKINKANNK
jgi:hypothetical protein